MSSVRGQTSALTHSTPSLSNRYDTRTSSGSPGPRADSPYKSQALVQVRSVSPTSPGQLDPEAWQDAQRGSVVSLRSRPDGPPHESNISRRRSRLPSEHAVLDRHVNSPLPASPVISSMPALSAPKTRPSPSRSQTASPVSSRLSARTSKDAPIHAAVQALDPHGSRPQPLRALTSPANLGSEQLETRPQTQLRVRRRSRTRRVAHPAPADRSPSGHDSKTSNAGLDSSKSARKSRPSSRLRHMTSITSSSIESLSQRSSSTSAPAPAAAAASMAALAAPSSPTVLPSQGTTRTQYKRVKAFLKTPGGLNGALAVAQFGISVALNRLPAYAAKTGHPQSAAGFDLAHLRNFIGDFRNFMALGDLLAIAKSAKAHHRAHRRHGATDPKVTTVHDRFQRGVGYLQHAANFGYSLFEAPAILSGKNIFRMSRDDGRNDMHKSRLTRVSCWFWALSIGAQFLEIGMESLADRRARHKARKEKNPGAVKKPGAAAAAAGVIRRRSRVLQGRERLHERERDEKKVRRRDRIRALFEEEEGENGFEIDRIMKVEHAARRSKRRRRMVTNAIWVPVAIGWSLRKNPLSSQLLNVLNVTGKASEVLSKWKDTR